ncbi:MAG: DUF3396 domain-containing protein [Polyangiaceae bacterium]
MPPTLPKDLDLAAEEDGIRLVNLVLMINLFTDKPLSELGASAIQTFERYRQIVGEDALRFYATATMQKHAAVTRRALTMLDTWLAPKAKRPDLLVLEIHDGANYNDAPASTAYAIHGREEYKGERDSDATLVRISLPYAWGFEPEKTLALTEELWALAPWRSGQVGFAFETSRYLPEPAQEHAYRRSMRHPGIDIAYTVNDAIMAGFDRVRRVGWLTLIDDAFVKQLGGLAELKKAVGPSVTVRKSGPGVVLQAGDHPEFGDVNRKDKLPAYRAVHKALRPLMMDPSDAPSLDIGGDFEGRTEAWLQRFEK